MSTVTRRKKATKPQDEHAPDDVVDAVDASEEIVQEYDEQQALEIDEGDGWGLFLLVLMVLAGIVCLFWFLYSHVMQSEVDAFQRRGPKVDAKHVHVTVNLTQLYTGHTAHISIDRQLVCHHCAGTGIHLQSGFHKCTECDGTGVRTFVQQVGNMKQYVRSHCQKCHGRGQVPNKHCDVCHGHGVHKETKQLAVEIEKGMHHGDHIVLKNAGDQMPKAIPGDVIVHVQATPHPVFRRHQDDLEMTLNVTLLEALVGFERSIRHVDGHHVPLTRDDPIQPDAVWKIAKEGMPVRGKARTYGDLRVLFHVEYPTTLSASEKARIEQLLP